MWWAGFDRSYGHLYLGLREVAWLGRDGHLWRAPTDGVEDALVQLMRQFDESLVRAPRRVRIWLSGALCSAFLFEVPVGLSEAPELERVAAAIAPSRTGLVGSCRVWCGGSGRDKSMVVAATLQTTLDSCLRTMGDRRIAVASVRPWWGEALRGGLATVLKRGTGTLAVHERDSLTVFSGAGGQFDEASTHAPLADLASTKAAWLRVASGMDAVRLPTVRVTLDLALRGPGSDAAYGALARWTEIEK